MGLLGEMTVAFKGDVSPLKSAVGAAQGILGQIGQGNFAGVAVSGLGAITTAAIGVGVASTVMAGNFEAGLTSLVTGAGEAQKNIGMVGDGIKSLSISTATSTKQLTDGMYMIESAGYHGASGLNVLKIAAQGAKVGNADLGVTANALTTILTDYHLRADESASAMNGLTATVASGKTKLQDLASSMGTVLPLASSLGISFPQVAGAIATMTNAGMGAQRASQNLSNAIRSLAAPGTSAQKSMKQVGITAQELKDTLTNQGLTAAIQLVSDQVGKTFPAGSVQAVTAFKAIMGGATGYNVALMLGGKNMDIFKGNVKNISEAMNTGTNSVTGWTSVQGTFNFKMQQAQQAANVLMITLGQQLLPVFGSLISAVTPLIVAFATWITTSNVIPNTMQAISTTVKTATAIISGGIGVIQAIAGFYNQWHTPILIVASAIMLFFLPAMVQSGVQAAVSGARIASSFVVSLVQTGIQAAVSGARVTASFVASVMQAGVQGWASAGKLAMFVGSLIASGAQAVVNAAKITASFIASMIQSGVQATIAGARIVATFVASLVTTAAQAVATGATFVASLIPAIISFTTEALVAAATAIPAILAGFAAWVVGAAAVAIANIAAFWPIYLIVLGIVAVIAIVVIAIKNWGAISTFVTNIWNNVKTWFVNFWHFLTNLFTSNIDTIKNILMIAGIVIITIFTGPWLLIILYMRSHWQQIQSLVSSGIKIIQNILQSAGTILYNLFIKPFVDAWNMIRGIFANIQQGIQNVLNAAGNIGSAISSNMPHIPGFASGVQNFAGGFAIVGERGPELLQLPSGSNVYPSGTLPSSPSSTPSTASVSGDRQDIYIQLDSTTIAHVVGNKQAKMVRARMGRRAA